MVTTHISNAWDGAIVQFPASACFFMKVCGRDGIGGVVNLHNGLYLPVRALEKEGLGEKVAIVAMNLDDFLMGDEKEF